MALLPIFPLGTVLMPGGTLGLQLFEPRYLELLRDLVALPEQMREFGVVAIRLGHEVGEHDRTEVYETGCVALLEQVTAVGPARYSVTARGVRRFRMGPLAVSSTPYLCAEVDELGEGRYDVDRAERLAEAVHAALQTYRQVLPLGHNGAGPSRLIPPADLSYAVAGEMRLTLEDEQRLLEMPDVVARLSAAYRLLQRETGLLKSLQAVPVRSGMLPGKFSRN